MPLTNSSASAGASPSSACSRYPGANLDAQPAFCEYLVSLMRVRASTPPSIDRGARPRIRRRAPRSIGQGPGHAASRYLGTSPEKERPLNCRLAQRQKTRQAHFELAPGLACVLGQEQLAVSKARDQGPGMVAWSKQRVGHLRKRVGKALRAVERPPRLFAALALDGGFGIAASSVGRRRAGASRDIPEVRVGRIDRKAPGVAAVHSVVEPTPGAAGVGGECHALSGGLVYALRRKRMGRERRRIGRITEGSAAGYRGVQGAARLESSDGRDRVPDRAAGDRGAERLARPRGQGALSDRAGRRRPFRLASSPGCRSSSSIPTSSF
jgi:hypothetical protein